MPGLPAFERMIESLVERSVIAPLRGRLQPIEIAKRIERAMRDGALVGVDANLAPNEYLVRLNPTDFEPLQAARSLIEGELARYVAQAGSSQGYVFLAPPRVRMEPDATVGRRSMQIDSSMREPAAASTTAPPLAQPHGRAGRHGGDRAGAPPSEWVLDFGDWQAPLPPGVARVGRALDSDVVVPSPRVSRRHAEIHVGPDGVRIRDLGSTNGTTVDGRPIAETTLAPGARLAFGGVDATLRAGRPEDERRAPER